VGPGRPLYLFVYDGAGKCMAQGSTSTFVGTNRLAVKDPDGKPYIAEIIKLGKDAGKGWVDYKFLTRPTGGSSPRPPTSRPAKAGGLLRDLQIS